MSGLALGWARKHAPAPTREVRALLMFLADNANELIAFPSKRTLAEDMMVSEKTVMRLLAQAVDAGCVIRLDVEDKATRRTRTCGYYFPIHGRPPTAAEIAIFEREVGGRVTHVSPWEGDTDVPQEGDTGVRGRGTTVSPLKSPLEPSEPEGSSPRARARVAEDLIEAIRQAMPVGMGKVSSEPAYREALEVLAERGEDLSVLPGCLHRLAADPLFKGLKVPPRLEAWLLDGKWRFYLPQGELALEPAAEAGPPELPRDVADVLYSQGRDWVASWLRKGEWRADLRMIVCALSVQRDEINRRVGKRLATIGVTVGCAKEIQAEGVG